MADKEFEVNERIVLKLEEGKTNIYVGGELFRQCKYVVLNKITGNDIIDVQNQVKEAIYSGTTLSIDEQVESLDKRREREEKSIFISPEEEFWAHCSNLQVWSEQDYNPKFLHSNLSYPLLKGLVQLNDVRAKRIFKESVIKRFSTVDRDAQIELLEQGYLKDITREELIDNCISDPEEISLLYDILNDSEEDGFIYQSNAEIINPNSPFINERFFFIEREHVARVDLNINGKTKCHLQDLPKFKNLRALILHMYEGLLNLGELTLKSLEYLEFKIYKTIELDIKEIIKIAPNLTIIRFSEVYELEPVQTIIHNVLSLQELKNLNFTSMFPLHLTKEMRSALAILEKKGIRINT